MSISTTKSKQSQLFNDVLLQEPKAHTNSHTVEGRRRPVAVLHKLVQIVTATTHTTVRSQSLHTNRWMIVIYIITIYRFVTCNEQR
jgi:hypothetical protein